MTETLFLDLYADAYLPPIPSERPKRQGKQRWTPAEDAILKANLPSDPNKVDNFAAATAALLAAGYVRTNRLCYGHYRHLIEAYDDPWNPTKRPPAKYSRADDELILKFMQEWVHNRITRNQKTPRVWQYVSSRIQRDHRDKKFTASAIKRHYEVLTRTRKAPKLVELTQPGKCRRKRLMKPPSKQSAALIVHLQAPITT